VCHEYIADKEKHDKLKDEMLKKKAIEDGLNYQHGRFVYMMRKIREQKG
jgi:hypothetical protein